MDETGVWQKILDLLDLSEKDSFTTKKIQGDKIRAKNGDLYNHFDRISHITNLFLGEQGTFFQSELYMAYHILEETGGFEIPYVTRSTIDEYLQRVSEEDINPAKELEELAKSNPAYKKYVNGTFSHWSKLYSDNREITLFLARHLIFLGRLIEIQKKKDLEAKLSLN